MVLDHILIILLIIAVAIGVVEIERKNIVKKVEYKKDMEVLSPSQNTTWQEDYNYTLDEENKIISLKLWNKNPDGPTDS